MLRVTVEIIPLGDEAKREVLGTLEIVNDGTSRHRPEYGNYRYTLSGRRMRRITDHLRETGYWRLIRDILIQEDDEEIR